MALMRERLTAMEALLLQHKIMVPKPIKMVESSMETSARINQRKLMAARALERLKTDGVEVSFSFARPTSRAAPAESLDWTCWSASPRFLIFPRSAGYAK